MAWRLAKSLEVLRNQANELAPNRSKISDGTIGDTSHTSRRSDHNPDENGVVKALDLTHDPKSGADMGIWSEQIRVDRPRALSYIIFNQRISSSIDNWTWRRYTGSNPHTSHMHISVRYPYVDDTFLWPIGEELANSDEILDEVKSIKNFLLWGFHPRAWPDKNGKPQFQNAAFSNGELGKAILSIQTTVRKLAVAQGIDPIALAEAVADEMARRMEE